MIEPSISHRFAARALHDKIKDTCESLIRGDRRTARTEHLAYEQQLELFRNACAVVNFYHALIAQHGKRLEFDDNQVFTRTRQYARHLALTLRDRTRSARDTAELTGWLEVDRRMPQLLMYCV